MSILTTILSNLEEERRRSTFDPLDIAGKLEIEVKNISLDSFALGVLQINLHEISNKVGFWLLNKEARYGRNTIMSSYHKATLDSFNIGRQERSSNFTRQSSIIQTNIENIGIGSLHETVSFGLVTALAIPSVQSILQNLAANIIWLVSTSGIGVIIRRRWSEEHMQLPDVKFEDTVDIIPNLKQIISSLPKGERGSPVELELRYKTRNNEKIELLLRIE